MDRLALPVTGQLWALIRQPDGFARRVAAAADSCGRQPSPRIPFSRLWSKEHSPIPSGREAVPAVFVRWESGGPSGRDFAVSGSLTTPGPDTASAIYSTSAGLTAAPGSFPDCPN